ncbi:glycosylhydrolase-like jelly roll fold domain-containing protein [Paenibacillus alkalitolerans]|uniref:glycosylhydrolase-like jelly roll fold domain-containing protein n=1 Tax=Paenibacillus alkalitolerans TaxID=2799335 RepID=UPI0018F4BFB9|nr:glycosylhydrolase-like jelly roll fold domain-containing protein [Paenibacillus alkalitolerans]
MFDQLRKEFMEPSGLYSPIPFWFWNDELTKEELIRQIRDFHSKEVEGFVLHPRIGIPKEMPYLSDSFMDLVEAAVREAAELNMQVILYDEGMYPSGSANGEVVRRNPKFGSRGLRMLELPADGPIRWKVPLEEGEQLVSVQAVKISPDKAVSLDETIILKKEDGFVEFAPPDPEGWLLVAFVETFTNGTIRGIHYGQDDGEPDAPRSADLLNPEAVRLFIELTHERYYRRIGRYFGNTVIAMFTDEPDLMGRRHRKGLIPWTGGFLAEFIAGGGREEELSALWLDAGVRTESIRQSYRKAVRERMERVYYKPLYDWCEERGIALTGHPAASDDIGLLRYFHIPGQDIVWRWLAPEDEKGTVGRHSTMGKCSSDAARHRGRRRNLNECFGVCGQGNGWALTAGDIKWYLDWLFVRGVNLISPHAFYYSIDGKRLHERAPDVGPNNIWWPEFARFSRYIKRMSWVMTDSANTTNVAVLCQADRLSWRVAKPMFERQLEFNYLEESLLQDANVCKLEGGAISIANQRYDTIVLDKGALLEPSTWSKLETFVRQGGTVLEWIEDGTASAPNFGQLTFDALERLIDEACRRMKGKPDLDPAGKDLRVSHVVKEGLHLYVIVNEGESAFDGKIAVAERGRAEIWNAWTGAIEPAAAVEKEAGTEVSVRIERRECLIVAVDPYQKLEPRFLPIPRLTHHIDLSGSWNIEGREDVSLKSWVEWDGMEHFSGTLSYDADVTWEPDASYDDIILDLGEVHEMARVYLNGQEIGVRLWGPYRWSVKDRLRNGVNKLRVEVTNTLANRYDRVSLPSGMLGPVGLYCYISSGRND